MSGQRPVVGGRQTPRLSRRSLLGLGLAATGSTLAGCGSSPATVHPLLTVYTGDAQTLALLFAVEGALLRATAVAVSSAVAGKYGTVPPAVTAALGVAGDHHSAHLGQWRTRLIAAGVQAPASTLLSSQLPALTQLATATSMAEAIGLLAGVQRSAVATYLASADGFGEAANRTLLATIAPVEAEHGATWDLLAGIALIADPQLAIPALTLPSARH